MAEVDKHTLMYDVLKSFNTAVITTKLYPPSSPQVDSAEKAGYNALVSFVKRFGPLSLSFYDDEPRLCGLPISQKTLGKIPGFEVFQQLRLLQMNYFVIDGRINKKLFRQLLVFFITSPKLIRGEGGGRSYTLNLGINEFFPLEYSDDNTELFNDAFADVLHKLFEEKRIRSEHLHSFVHPIDTQNEMGQRKAAALADLLQKKTSFADLVLGGFSSVCKGNCRIGGITFPKSLPVLLDNIETIISKKDRDRLAKECGALFVSELDDFALHILFLQDLITPFGEKLYYHLLRSMGIRLDAVAELMRRELETLKTDLGKASDQYVRVKRRVQLFLSTEQGQHYSLRAKTKKLLESGEKERQAKRIEAGVKALLQGDLSRFYSKEISEQLPATIGSLIHKKKEKPAAQIVEQLVREIARSAEKDKRNVLIPCLIEIGEHLVNNEKWAWLERLSAPLMAWLKGEDEAHAAVEKATEVLICLQNHYFDEKNYDKAEKILSFFFLIRSGKLKKDESFVSLVAKVQDMSIEKVRLISLLEKVTAGGKDVLYFERQLILLGPMSARFLLKKLFTLEEKEIRLKVLALLSKMGGILPPILIEKLREPMPWFAKRNVLRLLAVTGTERDILPITDYLNHEDIRVQQEAFDCILKLSGEDRKTNLLDALNVANGGMKERIVRALIPLADDHVVRVVLDMVKDWRYFPEETCYQLLIETFHLLGRIHSKEGEKFIMQFLAMERDKETKKLPGQVWVSAKEALRRIRLHRISSKKDTGKVEEEENRKTQPNRTYITSDPDEAAIQKKIQMGNLEEASDDLLLLVEKMVERRCFKEAELLREWLVQINGNALHKIMRAAEIIENGKSNGVLNDYLQIWSSLQDSLTTEEFNALYYSMDHLSYSGEEMLVSQGDYCPALFFINHGKIKIFYKDDNKEVFIKNFLPGEIFGIETFFDSSFWTVSAVAVTSSEVSVLSLRKTKAWASQYPGLEAKLQDFCIRNKNTIARSIKEHHTSRREYEHLKLQGDVVVHILKEDGSKTGAQVQGDLLDISQGGGAFTLRITHKKNARFLLGRKICAQFHSTTGVESILSVEGILISVRSLYSRSNEYSIHIRFVEPLKKEEVTGIIEACLG